MFLSIIFRSFKQSQAKGEHTMTRLNKEGLFIKINQQFIYDNFFIPQKHMWVGLILSPHLWLDIN